MTISDPELELTRSIKATVNWRNVTNPSRQPKNAHGIYMIRDAAQRLCYIGETKSPRDRLAAHRQAAKKCAKPGTTPGPWKISLGVVQPGSHQKTLQHTGLPTSTAAEERRLRRAIEHATINAAITAIAEDTGLKRDAAMNLIDNRSSNQPFLVGDGGVAISHSGVPKFRLPSGKTFSLGSITKDANAMLEIWLE